MPRPAVLVVVVLVACGAIFKPKRKEPPDTWALKAGSLHSMMTASPEFLKGTCSAAPTPDLQLFCEKRCDQIGELTLKAYCAWDCESVKNPDVGVICKLERSRDKTLTAAECDAIGQTPLREHCHEWMKSRQ